MWLYGSKPTRDGRAHENEKRIVKIQLAAQGRMGRATSVADTLRCLELDMARYQDRIAGSTAHFLCRYPFSHCDYRSFCRLGRASRITAAARIRLFGSRFYRRSDVCRELRPAFLGRTARFIR